MRIAVLGDIHGNRLAFEAALADVAIGFREQRCDRASDVHRRDGSV